MVLPVVLEPVIFESPEDNSDDDTAVLIVKVVFIFVSFAEALISGMIPTWVPSCRENPKVMGIANSFAAGVFIAIALIHMTPEQIEGWNEIDGNAERLENDGKVFPLPEILIFAGYTFILILDKVLFDTHALFDHDDEHGHGPDHADPAENKLEINLKASMARAQAQAEGTSDPAALKKSRIEEREDTEDAVKAYLNPHDRFATRMRASMTGSKSIPTAESDQQALFVDSDNVNLTEEQSKYLSHN